MTPELQDLTQRLEEVEKQVAHLAALAVERSDTDACKRTLAAQSFIVRDSEGRRRAEFGMVIPDGGTEADPWLGFFDADESIRAGMGFARTGKRGGIEGPWIELYDARGKVGVEIEIGEHGPSLRMFNENGKATLAVTTSELGPCVTVSNPNGDESLTIHTTLAGTPELLIDDGRHDNLLKLAVGDDGPCLLFGKDNKVFWSAP